METNNNPMPANIFQEGKFAHGDSFIGRNTLLSELIQSWEESNGNGTFSVVGLNRMGKTSLVHEFAERVKAIDSSTICIIVSLGQNTWPSLIQLIMKIMLRENSSLDDYSQSICRQTCEISLESNNFLNENEVILNYIDLLKHFENCQQHFLFVIDEFDKAKKIWKNKINYFEGIRDSVQYPGFFILISRRPLELIEADSYGNSCFHNVFTEIHVCAFERDTDMNDYYAVLSDRYRIVLNKVERKKVEEYTGFCPTFLVGLGNRLASASIKNVSIPSIDDVFSDQDFQVNIRRHYDEFLKRMMDDGLWNDLVQIIMDIFYVCNSPDSEDTYRTATIQNLRCRGYLRQKENGDYVVFSDDFSAWAKNKLYRNEVTTIYSTIIKAEVVIKDLLNKKMPLIWKNFFPGSDWEDDFRKNTPNVPQSVKYLTSGKHPHLKEYLKSAQKYNANAGVADALPIKAKLALLKEYWGKGISDSFNSDPYSDWEDCFNVLLKIRNPLFHAMIDLERSSTDHYFLLGDVNEKAKRIIQQLSS